MSEAFINLLSLFGLVVLGIFIVGALAPFEALGWWAGWFGESLEAEDAPNAAPTSKGHCVVYLSGIHSVSGESHTVREAAFLERLKGEFGTLDAVLIDDIFPYSVTNRALTSQRLFSWAWRWLHKRDRQGQKAAGLLINLRNFWQVGVSADRRYGPIYNQGSAKIILACLRRHGYSANAISTLTLIGYSGGGQIAVGAAPYLKEVLNAPIRVISLGGVISADPGILALERLYYLYGKRDHVQHLGAIFFPGRWPLLPHSAWNQGRSQHKVELLFMGDMRHAGRGSYLDTQRLVGGPSCLDKTVQTIKTLIARQDAAVEPPGVSRPKSCSSE